MKNVIKAIGLLAMVVGLTACNSSGTDTSSATSEPETSSVPSSSSNPSSSSEEDPYKDRVFHLDFDIVDVTRVHYRAEDPEQYEDMRTVEGWILDDPIKMYYLDEINDVYYVPLASYASLIENDLKAGYTSSVVEKGTTSIWTIKEGEEIVYRLSLDAKDKMMTLDGELDSEFLKNDLEGKTGESAHAQVTNEYIQGHENETKYYPFANYDIDVFEADGKYCYPFALINFGLSLTTQHNFYFDTYHQQLIEFTCNEQFKEVNFLLSEGSAQYISAEMYLKDSYEAQWGDEDTHIIDQPAGLNEFNKKFFYFLMDNVYGMASQKGIFSMSEYFEQFDNSDQYTSLDGGTRFAAYSRSIDMLNDLHTILYGSPFFTGTEAKRSHYEQSFYKDRFDLKQYLDSQRTLALKEYNEAKGSKYHNRDLRISEDGKYGYFSFDSFDTYHTFEDEPTPEDLLGDTFYIFVRNFKEAKEKGVKRIIIDDTCNGGGLVTVMGKLLALMSKDNKAEIYLRSDDNDAIMKTTIRVDSNEDGVYDEKDCFGNDFEFYIITSNFSFSCGNAFPFYAEHYGLATIMGQRSGGGECCVFEYITPAGQILHYSSPYHVGYVNKDGNYVGNEYGAPVKHNVDGTLCRLYDIEYLANYLNTNDPFKAE